VDFEMEIGADDALIEPTVPAQIDDDAQSVGQYKPHKGPEVEVYKWGN
jgi:hypothetical protein